ncbi:DUF2550 family protein [Skermania sp. ID1734]|uniref:DUF2550 domain-containing protein n=1 Tax=Skermania sp. ID1734 TaxID=2597516 RepID=UPI00117C2A86|nr:DUF2550 domain-containing protein [Skermania sp. ID1734]TSD93889.1 DUF2550 family protein [Skermania sp. ID1734]
MVLLIVLVGVLTVLVVAVTAALAYRLVVLRRGGTAAIMRVGDAAGAHGWRHGLIRYGENTLVFYKLSSLRFGPDSRIARQGIAVVSRRAPRDSEIDIMSDEIVVLTVTDRGQRYEIALDRGALTAFLSWVESRPSDRSMRGRMD